MSLKRHKRMRKKHVETPSKIRDSGKSKPPLKRRVNSAEELLGDVEPIYDYDTIAFETAEVFANEGGRFAFSLFSDAPNRSQKYEEAAKRALTAALDKIP